MRKAGEGEGEEGEKLILNSGITRKATPETYDKEDSRILYARKYENG